MKRTLNNFVDREMLSLIEGVAFANVPAWYGATRRDLKMDVIAPKEREGHAPMPLIVWICGGAYRCVDRAVWLPQFLPLARRGYVIAGIEYRTAGEGDVRDAYCDVKTAIRYLKAHAAEYCIDPGRIAVAGESGGGTLATFAGACPAFSEFDRGDFLEYGSDVQAVVDFYGIVDYARDPFLTDGRDVPPFLLEDFLGLGYTQEEARRLSPISFVSADTPPFLIFHGNRDIRVPIAQSERLYDALQKAGVRADYYVVDGAGHGDASFYQDEKLEIVAAFLEEAFKR